MGRAFRSFVLSLVCCSCIFGAEYDLIEWICGSYTLQKALQDTECTTTLFRAPLKRLAQVEVAPNNDRLTVFSCLPDAQIVEVRDFGEKQPISIYTNNGQRENRFSPLGIMWSPDSDRVFVKYGYADVGNGFWFPHDPTTGDLVRNKDYYERLMTTPISKCTNSMCYEGREPIWTPGGREFESEHSARKAGYNVLLSTTSLRRKPDCFTYVKWKDIQTFY